MKKLFLMRVFTVFSAVVLSTLFAVQAAQAVTYTYLGLEYGDNRNWEIGNSGFFFHGPYEADMKVEFSFVTEAPLIPNTRVSLYPPSSSIPFPVGFDGKFSPPFDDGFVETDGDGKIIDWYFRLVGGIAQDLFLIISSPSGDMAEYATDTSAYCDDPINLTGCREQQEIGSAWTNAPGQWTVTGLPAVPAPASMPLVLTGLAGLAFVRRRKRVS